MTQAEEQIQTQTEEVKPVYRVSSGIPSFTSPNEQVAEVVQEQTQTETQVQENNTQAEVQEQPQVSDSEVSFDIPSFEAQSEQQAAADTEAKPQEGQAPVTIDWKQEIKKQDPKEILKELGYDDFVAELAEYRKNGGDVTKYLEAKAFDWNRVSHQDLVLSDLKAQYPNLSEEKIQKLFEAQYKQSEFALDEEKEIGAIRLEADAEKIRQAKIAEQQKFKVPEYVKPQEAVSVDEVQIQELQQKQQQEFIKFFEEHEATKALHESKRVTLDLGDNGSFSYNINDTKSLMTVIMDSEKWNRVLATNPQEADVSKLVPDVKKLQRLALVALNPNYEKDLVNYGKSLGLKSIVEEGQNAIRPVGHKPAESNESIGEAFATRAKVSTLGR